MIQRIQSLYLLVSLFLMGFLFVFPFAEIVIDGELMIFDKLGISADGQLLQSGLPIAILIGVIIVLHLVAIFSFKKRVRQMRIISYTILLMLGLMGMFYYYTYFSLDNATIQLKIVVAFPLVACILDYLAIRAIGKDEAMIRSIDRIR